MFKIAEISIFTMLITFIVMFYLQKAVLTYFLFVAIAIVNIFFNILCRSKITSDEGVNNIFQTLVCHGKMPTLLLKVCYKSDVLSIGNIIWSVIGFLYASHEVLMETVFVLGIIISSVVFLFATFDIERVEDENEFSLATHTDLSNMTYLAEEISDSIGDVLLGYLIYNATVTPKVIRNVFPNETLIFLSGIINHGPIFVGLMIASIASKRVIYCTYNK